MLYSSIPLSLTHSITHFLNSLPFHRHYEKIMNAPQVTKHFMPRIGGYVKRAEMLKKAISQTSSPSPTDKSSEEKREEEEEEDEDFDLDEELNKLVGMKNIKREILAMGNRKS